MMLKITHLLPSASLWGAIILFSLVPSLNASASTAGGAALTACLHAANAKRSVHVVSIGMAPSVDGTNDVKVTLITDAGATSGIQYVTFKEQGQTGRETVRLLGDVVYLQGDAFILEHFNGYSIPQAQSFAGRWVSIPKSNSAFASLAAALTVRSTTSELTMPSPKELPGTIKVLGNTVHRLESKVTSRSQSGTFTLYCRTGADPLPVEQLFKSGAGDNTITFSRWNEAVNVTVPTHAVAIAATAPV